MPTIDADEIQREIAEAAYFRWLNRGATHGWDVEDWLEAEKEIRARMSPKETIREPREFETLHGEVLELHATWRIFVELFTTQSAVALLNDVAPSAFRTIQRGLNDALIVGIGRLTDPATTGGQQNLNLSSLAAWVRGSGDSGLADELERAMTELKGGCATLRKWRNKKTAHSDQKVAMGEIVLPAIERSEIEGTIQRARDLMNNVAIHFGRTPTAYEALTLLGDGDTLLEVLSRGRAHLECEFSDWHLRAERRARDFPED